MGLLFVPRFALCVNRQIFTFLSMHSLNLLELTVSSAQEKIDENGRPIDEEIRNRIRELLETLATYKKAEWLPALT